MFILQLPAWMSGKHMPPSLASGLRNPPVVIGKSSARFPVVMKYSNLKCNEHEHDNYLSIVNGVFLFGVGFQIFYIYVTNYFGKRISYS